MRSIRGWSSVVALAGLFLMGLGPAFEVAGQRSQPCSAKRLEQARRSLRADNLSLAENLAEGLVNCPGALGTEAAVFWELVRTRRHNERLWQRSQLSIRRSRFADACEYLFRIRATSPDFPNLQTAMGVASCDLGLKELNQTLSQIDHSIGSGEWEEALTSLDEVSGEYSEREEVRERRMIVEGAIEEVKDQLAGLDYERAVGLFRQGDLVGARKHSLRALSVTADHREARALLETVEAQRVSEEKARAIARLVEEALQRAETGDLAAALEKVEESLAIDDSVSAPLELQRAIGEWQQHGETQLREAVRNFYIGEYVEAATDLEGFLGEKHPPRFAATASFYLGASLVSISARSRDEPDLEAARRYFRDSRLADPQFVPPLGSVSPKVRAVFSEAGH